MTEIAASEFAKNFGRYRLLAQREPIAITSHGHTTGYFMSEHEYREYERLKARARRAYSVADISDQMAAGLEEAQMSPEHDRLDDLLDE